MQNCEGQSIPEDDDENGGRSEYHGRNQGGREEKLRVEEEGEECTKQKCRR
jgi:hypothetical protein